MRKALPPFLCLVFALSAAAAPPKAPSVAPAPPREKQEPTEPAVALKAALEGVGAEAAKFADELAGDYLAFLLRAGESLDKAGVTKPAHRAAVLVPAANKAAAPLLAKFDDYAGSTRGLWRSKSAPLAAYVSASLDREADRLTEFLRADPLLVVGDAPVPDVMRNVAAATAKAESGPGFAARLRRAQVVGDGEVARVVKRRLSRESAAVGDGIADGYLSFLMAADKSLDQARVYDPKARGSVVGPQAKKTAESMLAEYDGYANTAREAFRGAGPVVEPAVEAALSAERARLSVFFGADLSALRAGIEAARDDGADPSGRTIRDDIELRARMEAAR